MALGYMTEIFLFQGKGAAWAGEMQVNVTPKY